MRTTFIVLRTLRLLALIGLVAGPAHAQIRGRSVGSPRQNWWISGGASAAVFSDINDGATGTVWKFGSDPIIVYRAAIEKALDEATTLGVSVVYGKVDMTLVPFVIVAGAPATAPSSPPPPSCSAGCAVGADLWQAMAQFRSGGGPGFHTFFEGNGGVTTFRGMRTADSSRIAVGKPSGSLDLSGTLGAGFGYTVHPGFVISLVQDFGIGYHSKTDLPEGTSRAWRVRNTRAALRFAF